MTFIKKIPQWENEGQKPPQSKISEGFKPMDHPPADWFNWYMNGTYEALKELQEKAVFNSLTWIDVTLKNGASTGDRPFQFASSGGLLLLRGHIKATREVVFGVLPEGAPKPPIKGAVASPSVSGTTGHSKLFLNSNGEFTLTGIHAKNENAVTGYYFDNCIIPLD